MTAAEAAMACWPIAGERPQVLPLPGGHIHDTYSVCAGDGARFVLQRFNTLVFPRPQAVMENLAQVLAHRGDGLVAPIASATGAALVTDARGDSWRLFPHVPSRSFERLPDALLEPAGAAFGGFLAAFENFPAPLAPVIDGFHDLGGHLRALDAAPKTRDAAAELRAVDALRAGFPPGAGERVIHGDCKINNLLFARRAPSVVAIIDLDTVMRGDPAWDFGDLVRSAFAGAEESGLGRPLTVDAFSALAKGFARAWPIDDSARYAAAPGYMSFMLAVRFLADHLRGDVYFKVKRRGDNLLRARSQLALAAWFRDAAPRLRRALDAL